MSNGFHNFRFQNDYIFQQYRKLFMKIRTTLVILTVLFSTQFCTAQLSTVDKLNQLYGLYQEKSITDKRFKQVDIIPLVEKRRTTEPFKVLRAGESIEGRPIYLVQIGAGKTKVLLWSQMHGDESTATMALMDMFNFFEANDAMNELREKLVNELSIYIIPMLNPDGAERFQRQNAIGIDLNRDALRLQTPEANILKTVRDEIEPTWGFNLHDQSRYYSVGDTDKPATISFLAPAFNKEKDINTVRRNSMKLIVGMNEVLQQYIPGQVAKYNDSFEPRAFGDNIQKWGTSTILIESGGHYDDREKQYIRKMNFLAIMNALNEIADGSYTRHNILDYEAIPFNSRRLYDLLLKRVNVPLYGQTFMLDLAFNRLEIEEEDGVYYRGRLAYIGDLSTNAGYKTLDASDYNVTMGKVHPTTFETVLDAMQTPTEEYLKAGYTTLKMTKLPPLSQLTDYPLQLMLDNQTLYNKIQLNGNPSFFLERNGVKEYAVINGRLIDMKE